jgi:hypothetical protein
LPLECSPYAGWCRLAQDRAPFDILDAPVPCPRPKFFLQAGHEGSSIHRDRLAARSMIR